MKNPMAPDFASLMTRALQDSVMMADLMPAGSTRIGPGRRTLDSARYRSRTKYSGADLRAIRAEKGVGSRRRARADAGGRLMRLPSAIRTRLFRRLVSLTQRRPPDFVIGSPERPYMERWWVIPRNRVFNIYLHRVLRDDDDRALHDHPWPSVSIILAGGCVEELPRDGSTEAARTRETIRRERPPGTITFRRASAPHRLITIKDRQADGTERPRACWSLFLTGPKVRTWGFLCPRGWRSRRDFEAWGCE